MSLEWMSWTWPTAVFFIALALAITGMTIWDTRVPSIKTKGFLPVPFTRGERFFLSVVLFFAVMILWVAFTDLSLLWALPIAFVLIFVLVRYG